MALAIIPARAGSRGIKGKNTAMCGGKPLVQWTLDAVTDSISIDAAVVSSDSREVLSLAMGTKKARPSERPAHLAQDDTSTEAVLSYLLDDLGWLPSDDIIVLLQPTSPLRTGRHVDEAIRLLWDSGADSCVSVVPSHHLLWDEGGDSPSPLYDTQRRPRRQEFTQFVENGSIYVFTMDHWRRTGNRLGGKVVLYEMAEAHALQVDTPFDLWMAQQLLVGALPEVRLSRGTLPLEPGG